MPDIHAVVKRTMRLSDPALEIHLQTPLCFSDKSANAFIIGLLNDDNTAASLTGLSVSGIFVRADNTDVSLTGSVSGNETTVVLSAGCYQHTGRFVLTIKLMQGTSVIRTLAIVRGRTMADTGDTHLDPEHVMPSLPELIAQANASIAAMEAKGAETLASIPSDYTALSNEVEDLKSALSEHNSMNSASAWGYFYAKGYFDDNLNYVAYDTIGLLRFPVDDDKFVILSCPEKFMDTISGTYRWTYELTDGTLSRSGLDNLHIFYNRTDGNYCAVIRGRTGVKYAYLTIYLSMMDKATVIMNNPLSASINDYKEAGGIIEINAGNTANELCFMSDDHISILTRGDSHITCLWKLVNAGDQFTNIPSFTGLSFKGSFHAKDGTSDIRINNATFACPKDGLVCLFDVTDIPSGIKYIPAKRINLHIADIDDLDLSSDNPYEGLNAVAFGTSLTYRSQSTGGYMQYLPGLSGMTFDNQGIGSARIKGNMLAAIKAYNNWSDKDVCILEGFVNDHGYEGPNLGTWKDTTESTVCGCVRVALNYMLAQNPNMTVFLILDHYGKNYNGVDSSSTAVNTAGDTLYEFQEEIAKVAESLGIPVIKLYEISQISENRPQYLMDNIHPTDLGARQTAYAIWYEMKRYHPNQVSTQ